MPTGSTIRDPRAVSPDSGKHRLDVVECFASIQGEGHSAGEPAYFVRLGGCNLACSWCDTRYAWDFRHYDRAREVTRHEVSMLASTVREQLTTAPDGRRVRLVITGGEPLLQQPGLEQLVAHLPSDVPIEIETNGTIEPSPRLLGRVDQWNVSPKLAHAGDPEPQRLRLRALTVLRDSGRAWLKLVVRALPDDVAEVEALLERLAWPRDRVALMACANTARELAEREPAVRVWSETLGVRLSPRLHLSRWNGERGR